MDSPSSCCCQTLAGRVLDELVSRRVLAALDLSLQAANHLQRERNRLTGQWPQRLERALSPCQRPERQDPAVEPENRPVAREPERRWEQVLAELCQLETGYERCHRTQSAEWTAGE